MPFGHGHLSCSLENDDNKKCGTQSVKSGIQSVKCNTTEDFFFTLSGVDPSTREADPAKVYLSD